MASRLQDVDVKSEAELIALGADKTALINTTKLYTPKSLDVLESVLRKNNDAAIVDPAINNDSSDGYEVGSRITNIATGTVFHCVDNSIGAAIWKSGGSVDAEALKESTNKFVKLVYIDAPITSINNRAQILDVTNTLKSLMPTERIVIEDIKILELESVDNLGGQVHEVVGDTEGSIRGVGNLRKEIDDNGVRISIPANETDSYWEITKYCTGLNILVVGNAAGDARLTVNNDPEGTNFMPPTISPYNLNIGNKPNTLLPMVSGLTLGWHTFKIRQASASVDFEISGIEVLDESASSSFFPGKGYHGLDIGEKLAFSTLDRVPSGIAGTKGARVINYLDIADNTAKQAFYEIPTGAGLFLGASDMSNSEVVGTLNWRKFGNGFSKDFSTLDTGVSYARAHTLEDNSTALTARSVRAIEVDGEDVLHLYSDAPAFILFTITCSSLSIVRKDIVNTSVDQYELYVDGVLQGQLNNVCSTQSRIEHLFSDLEYCTHTVEIRLLTLNAHNFGLTDFIIYEPKKPVLPVTALIVKDYNVVCDYVKNIGVVRGTNSKGVIKRAISSEARVEGIWDDTNATLDTNSVQIHSYGWAPLSNQNSANFEYTFIGSGFEYRTVTDSNSRIISIVVDGSSDLSGFVNAFTGSGMTWDPVTGLLTGDNTSGHPPHNLLSVILPYGKHTVHIEKASGAGGTTIGNFDVIQDVHANTIAFNSGFNSSLDKRLFTPVIPVENEIFDNGVKALIAFDGTINSILSKQNIRAVIDLGVGNYRFLFQTPFKNTSYSILDSVEEKASSTFLTQTIRNRRFDSVEVLITDVSGTPLDNIVNLAIFGDLVSD
jgi:hypothetical protein